MSELSQKLLQLKSVFPQSTAPKVAKGKDSLLFSAVKAARLSYDDILIIGQDGLNELVSIDSRFSNFSSSLFHAKNVQQNREQLSKKENEEIDEQIQQFCLLLGPYFMLKSAHKALEYLIRRYKYVFTLHTNNLESTFSMSNQLCSVSFHTIKLHFFLVLFKF
jgi:U3 small nucleolar RNA-associated protein 10